MLGHTVFFKHLPPLQVVLRLFVLGCICSSPSVATLTRRPDKIQDFKTESRHASANSLQLGHLRKCFSRIQPVHFNQEEFCRDLNILQNVEAEIAPFFHLETAINLHKNHTSQRSFNKIIQKVLNPTGALADCMAFSRVAFLNSWGSISRRKGRACQSIPAIPNLFSPWLHTDEHVRDIHVSCALACRRRSAVMFSIVHRPSSTFTPKQTPNKWEYSSEVVHKTGDQHQDLLELSARIWFLRRILWEPLLETSSLSLWLIRAQMVRQGL